jgi:hypothetical protein
MGTLTEKGRSALKITKQARVREGMAYTLRCDGVLLTVLLTPCDEEASSWRVELTGKRPSEAPVVVTELGQSRLEALRAGARCWESSLRRHGIDTFDWEAVARLLGEVRAV